MRKLAYSFAVIVSCTILFAACGYKPQDSYIGMNGESFIALNKNAVKSVANGKKNQFLFYGFTGNQKAHLKNTVYMNSGAAVSVLVEFDAKEKNREERYPFSFGFIYDEDLESIRKPDSRFLLRTSINGNFLECQKNKFRLSISLSSSQDMPCGFFVYGTKRFKVLEASITDPKIGWDNSTEIPHFAFGANGGNVVWNFTEADFSDAATVFPQKNSVKKIMPKIQIGLVPVSDNGEWKKQLCTSFDFNGEKIRLRLQKEQDSAMIQASSLAKPYGKISVKEHQELVTSIMLRANSSSLSVEKFGKVLAPLGTDLGLIMDWPQENWRCRDYELFEWDQFPGVLFFDFADYKIQNQFFTRLAYFVEKAGYRGTLVSDDFVENKRGYNAHDYRAEDLAAFFTLAEVEEFPLNERENLLREILVANKVIAANKDGTYSALKGAVVSFSRESPRYLRYTFLAHESWHGIYFIDEDFRNVVATCYSMFDSESMKFLKTFWETQPGLGYDRRDEYLMQNEFMAYIMQQSYANIQPYFLQVAGRGSVNRIQKEGAAYIRNTKAQAFVDAGEVLNTYAFDKWALACGRVSLIERD